MFTKVTRQHLNRHQRVRLRFRRPTTVAQARQRDPEDRYPPALTAAGGFHYPADGEQRFLPGTAPAPRRPSPSASASGTKPRRRGRWCCSDRAPRGRARQCSPREWRAALGIQEEIIEPHLHHHLGVPTGGGHGCIHVDLYRIEGRDQMENLGLEDILRGNRLSSWNGERSWSRWLMFPHTRITLALAPERGPGYPCGGAHGRERSPPNVLALDTSTEVLAIGRRAPGGLGFPGPRGRPAAFPFPSSAWWTTPYRARPHCLRPRPRGVLPRSWLVHGDPYRAGHGAGNSAARAASPWSGSPPWTPLPSPGNAHRGRCILSSTRVKARSTRRLSPPGRVAANTWTSRPAELAVPHGCRARIPFWPALMRARIRADAGKGTRCRARTLLDPRCAREARGLQSSKGKELTRSLCAPCTSGKAKRRSQAGDELSGRRTIEPGSGIRRRGRGAG